MTRSWKTVALSMALALVITTDAFADRTPIIRMPRQRVQGTRTSIRVPYLTNTGSAFGVYGGVAPRVYSAPVVGDPRNPGARPVFNLPFYGAKMSFSGTANGAVPVPRIVPQPIFR